MNVLEIVGAFSLSALALFFLLMATGHILQQKRTLKKQRFEYELFNATDMLEKFDDDNMLTPKEVISILRSLVDFNCFDEDEFIKEHNANRNK